MGILSTTASAETIYGNAQIASSKLKDVDDRGFTAIISASKSLEEYIDIKGFSIVGEFSKSMTKPSISSSEVFFNGVTTLKVTSKTEIGYWGLGVYGAYTHTVSEKLFVKARAGLVYLSTSWDTSVSCSGGCSASDSDSTTELAFGVGASYAFKDDMDIIVEFTKIDELSHFGIGVSMPFEL